MENNDSGVNTMLLVIIVVMLVAGGVWYIMRTGAPAASTPDDSANINVTLPTGSTGSENGGAAE